MRRVAGPHGRSLPGKILCVIEAARARTGGPWCAHVSYTLATFASILLQDAMAAVEALPIDVIFESASPWLCAHGRPPSWWRGSSPRKTV